uniref:Uncharacterized protein n=1 Tax=viral metagenome TaxID=1070528 RepID=A0A6H1ZWS6_9ZZZZ
MKTTDLQSQISDLKINLGVYRGREKDLLERSGVVKSITSLAADLKKTEKSLTIQKSTTKKLRKSREDALQGVCLRISTQIDNFLTVGTSSIEITEGKVKIGWIIANKFHPLASLSQGEMAEFLPAFSQVLSPKGKLKLSFLELTEAGKDAAESILGKVIQAGQADSQVIACSLLPLKAGDKWQTIRI